MTEEQAMKTYDRALKLENEFGEYFTGKFLAIADLLIGQLTNKDRLSVPSRVKVGDS